MPARLESGAGSARHHDHGTARLARRGPGERERERFKVVQLESAVKHLCRFCGSLDEAAIGFSRKFRSRQAARGRPTGPGPATGPAAPRAPSGCRRGRLTEDPRLSSCRDGHSDVPDDFVIAEAFISLGRPHDMHYRRPAQASHRLFM